MLTGSMAYNFYTVPRMTRDIDIVIEITERDAELEDVWKAALG